MMKHLELRQIFNSLVGVSSADETPRLMLDILLHNITGTCCGWVKELSNYFSTKLT